MTFATSYFYQIRFFKPHMIPISTAVSDPAWFHQNKGNNFTFYDKNNVINGLRCAELAPGKICQNLCRGKDYCDTNDPNKCLFLKMYHKQLKDEFNINNFLQRCERAAGIVKQKIDYTEEPVIVLIVHEAYSNPCSERNILLKFFNENNIPIKELKYPLLT